ncbi:MAG TPA: hypothetical protein PK402_03485, partial [Tepidisphaeraceae bacterium]|nr:hypothetical protein [Tepidisphaeraceae bacterium]
SPETSSLKLAKSVPDELHVGKPYQYTLSVTNISQATLNNVAVTETLSPGFSIGDVDGARVTNKDGRARMLVGELAPGETRKIIVNATVSTAGSQSSCASVTFDTSLCMDVNVVSPSIKVAIAKGTDSSTVVCKATVLKFDITNDGTGVARNIRFESKLPEGAKTPDGLALVSAKVGDLAAGEKKTVELPVKFDKKGEFKIVGKFMGDEELVGEQTVTAFAREPELLVEKAGPNNAYVTEQFTYDITITNRGDAPAENLVVTDTLPGATSVVKVSDGGAVEGGKVTWKLGTLAKGATRKLTLMVSGTQLGTARNTVSATADCAKPATVSAETQIVGVPALLMEVVDDPDPIRLNGQTTYTIRVTNQGSAIATNVKMVATLEDTMTYVSSGGTTAGNLDGKTITFDSLATLAPKAVATYTVVVRAKSEGDVRFKATLTSDQLKRPVEETESTNFYK